MPDGPPRPTNTPPSTAPISGESVADGGTLSYARSGPPQPNNLAFLSPPRGEGELGWLAHYRVLRVLGQGGMGMVFQAEDTKLQRPIALKVMLPIFAADANARERFLREARLAAAVGHDHVVAIHAVEEVNGTPFIAMELLQGQPLDALLKERGTIALGLALRVARQMAEGLAAAHARGLIHRDIKPGNVWLENRPSQSIAPDGELSCRVKLLDFGLARLQQDDAHLSQSGAIFGTPAFMSPEQARALPVDPRTDLFALGAVLYQMVTGRLPFTGATAQAMLCSVMVDHPTPATTVNPHVPPAVSMLIDRLMAKDPNQRPRDAREVAAALANLERASAERLVETAVGLPNVAYPVQNPFADITKTDPAPARESSSRTPRDSGRSRQRLWLVAVVSMVVIASVALVLSNMNMGRSGDVAKPDDSKKGPLFIESKEVDKSGKSGVPDAKKVPEQKKEPPSVEDHDRSAAEWVRQTGGLLVLRQKGKILRPKLGDALPTEPFQLIGVDLTDRKQITDADLEKLRGLQNVDALDLTGTRISGSDMSMPASLPKLSALYLRDVNLTDAALRQLSGARLQRLEITSPRLTDAGLQALEKMPLKELALASTKITDAGVERLASQTELEFLGIGGDGPTAAGLRKLPTYKKLLTFHLAGKNFDDGIVDFVERQPKLAALRFELVPLTDDGLQRLAKLPALKKIHLDRSKITPKAAADFQTARPDCKLQINGVGEPRK